MMSNSSSMVLGFSLTGQVIPAGSGMLLTVSAGITGDVVGDPFKDTAGPALHVLVKLINTISLTFIPLFLLFA